MEIFKHRKIDLVRDSHMIFLLGKNIFYESKIKTYKLSSFSFKKIVSLNLSFLLKIFQQAN